MAKLDNDHLDRISKLLGVANAAGGYPQLNPIVKAIQDELKREAEDFARDAKNKPLDPNVQVSTQMTEEQIRHQQALKVAGDNGPQEDAETADARAEEERQERQRKWEEAHPQKVYPEAGDLPAQSVPGPEVPKNNQAGGSVDYTKDKMGVVDAGNKPDSASIARKL